MPDPLCQTFALQLPLAAPGPPLEFSVARGQVLLVDGAPEAGRSTLLKVLAGLLRPTGGELALFGQQLRQLSPSRLMRLRKRMAVVFEKDGLIPSWSARQNLLLPLRFHRPDAQQTHLQRISRWLAVIDEPPEILDKRVSTLTARQRRRLALLRSLLVEPELLLIDDLPNYLSGDDRHNTDLLARLDTGRRAIIACAPADWCGLFGNAEVATLQLGAPDRPQAAR